MNVLSTNVYVGPNVYANFPVIRQIIDLGPLEDYPTRKLGDFHERLCEALPGLHEHGCSYGEPGGFIRRLKEDEGTWMGHILEHMAIELQALTGAGVTFGKTRGTGLSGQYHVVYSYEEERVGIAAADLAMEMIHHAIPEELRGNAKVRDDFNFEEELNDLITYAQRRQFGPSTASLIRAANRLDRL